MCRSRDVLLGYKEYWVLIRCVCICVCSAKNARGDMLVHVTCTTGSGELDISSKSQKLKNYRKCEPNSKYD
jgi:hypothetical protein